MLLKILACILGIAVPSWAFANTCSIAQLNAHSQQLQVASATYMNGMSANDPAIGCSDLETAVELLTSLKESYDTCDPLGATQILNMLRTAKDAKVMICLRAEGDNAETDEE